MSRDQFRNFQAVWRRSLQLGSLDELNVDLIRSWSAEKGIDVTSVVEQSIGIFTPIPAIVLSTSEGIACFPKVSATDDPGWMKRRVEADRKAAIWDRMEWFSPLWIPLGEVSKLLDSVANAPKERAKDLFDYHTSTMYTIPFQAICIAQIMPQTRSLAEVCSLAREAFLAFYSGYRGSSIAALIPTIEGGITRILGNADIDLPIAVRVDRLINRAIRHAADLHFEGRWIPEPYRDKEYLFSDDERIFTFETYRLWLQTFFFQRTGDYDGITWLNRNMFAHGTASSWQDSANFTRLVVALTTLALIESWHDETHKVSLFFPEMNDDGKLLWQQALFQAEAQGVLKLMEQERYKAHGRLVPEMPTDNGALLRKALLSDACIKDLVRPLRNAGWSVAVEDPHDTGLYVKVKASNADTTYRAVLLYSCATGNDVYKELAEDADVILYMGSPYHQDSYAYGLNIDVGPVAGWQPPLTRKSASIWQKLQSGTLSAASSMMKNISNVF